MANKIPSGPRCAAIVGPYLSGKTTLLESILHLCGETNRKGTVTDGNTIGDASPEARARNMSIEVNVATANYLGEEWTFLDNPGSVELTQDVVCSLSVADAAVVVCEPGKEKALAVTRLLLDLEEKMVPHVIFINKIDGAESKIKETFDALQEVSQRPLVLREIPIREENHVTGYVDLASERAFSYKPGAPSEIIEIPQGMSDRKEQEVTILMESLADFNDELMEKLLEDEIPASEEIYENLKNHLQTSSIVPVFFGSAENDNGIKRLMKALRHEANDIFNTQQRLGIGDGESLAQVFKIYHGAASGKISMARVWRGEISEGQTLNGMRVGGIFKMFGQQQVKLSKASVGQVVGLSRMDSTKTGDFLSDSGNIEEFDGVKTLRPVYALSINTNNRDDEVKLGTALNKVVEEDVSLSYGPNPDTGEMVLRGQGDTHLRISIEKLENRNKLSVDAKLPQVAYKETIRKPVNQHARHKKQSGGHGQFGDVNVEIKPLPRGSGFEFTDSITGGAIPKQYIPSVENGVKEYMGRGPLGFPVVDVAVELTDGQFHAVDSSDQAFKTAGSLAMREGMPKCSPVLLEPIFEIIVSTPTDFTSRVQRLLSSRRGQIMGFNPKDGWKGWDEVSAHLPESETLDLINELRSLSQGTASFVWQFDRLQEFTGKEADDVVVKRNGT